MSRPPDNAPRKKRALLDRMTFGLWYDQDVLAQIGGTRFAARLHDLVREQPHLAYDCVPFDEGKGRYRYRLRLRRNNEAPPKPKQSAKARIAELEREVAELRVELAKQRLPNLGKGQYVFTGLLPESR